MAAYIFLEDQQDEYKKWQVEAKEQPDFNKHYGGCVWQRLSKGLKIQNVVYKF